MCIRGEYSLNKVTLKGYIKDIEPSHTIQGIEFNKAKLLVPRDNGTEDVLNIKFKKFTNPYKENDMVSLTGNIRSYSHKVSNNKNKVDMYVFTYFDKPETDVVNSVELDGRICKISEIRKTRTGKDNLHFILANNIVSEDKQKRLNSYIPCICWGKIAKELSSKCVDTKLKVSGEFRSREHKQLLDNGDYEIRIAHEVYITKYEVVD